MSLRARGDEHRYDTVGLGLVISVGGERRDAPLEPLVTFLAEHFTHVIRVRFGPVLDRHVRVGDEVVDPDRVRRTAAIRPDQRVFAVVLDA
jgi:hypothetical protein